MQATERQFSLVLALMASRQGMTRHDILSRVEGYRRAFEQSGESDTLTRQFERDKVDLRDIGFDIRTDDDPARPGDNRFLRYRIDPTSVAMPAGLELEPEEARLLALAAGLWREGALAGESRRGLTKLRAQAAAHADQPSMRPRLRAADPAMAPLVAAIEAGARVRFDYRKPDSETSRRRVVEPLALVLIDGRWVLTAFDLDRGAWRRFLLRRMTSAPVRAGEADPARLADAKQRDIAGETLELLHAHAAARPVLIETVAGSDAEVRLGARAVAVDRADPRRLTLHTADPDELADELAAYGPELTVLEPDSLRRLVRERLERALAEHVVGEAP